MVKITDNQIDVVMKSFQALTVTCARCHDHKFDALSQADFYALYPAFAAARPTQVQIDLPERLHKHDARLLEIKRALQPSPRWPRLGWRRSISCRSGCGLCRR